MSEAFYKRKTCRLCEDPNLELIMDIGATPIGDDFIPQEHLDKIQEEYPLEVCLCAACGLLQITGVINQELVYGDYLYETASSLGLKAHFQHYADEVIRRIAPPKGSLVIDIGSNDGTLLKYFQAKEMRVLGVEPARAMAQRVTESGTETLARFFTLNTARDIKKQYGAASIITANNIVANVDDLKDFIKGIRELLAADGVFVFETGYGVDMVQNVVFDNIYHEHLCYFSLRPLVQFFKNYELELVDVERIATKGGSIRCIVQLAGAGRPVSLSVTELVTLEKELGFDGLAPFRLFADKVGAIKSQLKKELNDIKAQGKTVAGYGASVGVTTMLYYFGLENTLSFLIDDNPVRQNLYSPGHHMRVLSYKAMYDEKIDYVLLLAWRYADPIVRRHTDYLKQGGTFIKCLPTYEVISSGCQHSLIA